ncbi:LOW QUALITY PROTEIN: DBF4-type zinc finger-containing protein 2 [Discoglossus pictus]
MERFLTDVHLYHPPNIHDTSLDWEMSNGIVNDQPKTLFKNLDLLKETTVNLEEDYTSKLSSILCVPSMINEEREHKSDREEPKKLKVKTEILKALPHIPHHFVGKTWSQVNYEDDLKIEALVQEFKKGKFHCYFENGSAKSGRRRRRLKSEQFEKKVEPQKEVWKETEIADELPSFLEGGHDSDIPSVISDKVIKPEIVKPARRTWRLASRCQIVKVSHGTQTSLHSYQLPKRNAIKDEHQPESRQDLPYEFEDEKTPDMKRMCSLRLPESYTKILTPVQPKTVVYVLSHPDAKQRKNKPACISKQGSEQYSTESKDSVYYKYKQSPLKYYDPLTNRILKTPPRNAVRATSVKGPCVRKLFRSLSSDVNVHKLDLEQKESTASKKSLSVVPLHPFTLISLKGSDVKPKYSRKWII